MYDIHFDDDQEKGPVVVLLHGFMGSLHDWSDLRNRLRPRYRTMAIDLPGHGQTPLTKDFDFNDTCQGLADWLRSRGLQDVHLIGYSMGARIALGMSLRDADCIASLVLESAHPGLEIDADRKARQVQESTWAAAVNDDQAKFLSEWADGPLFRRQRQRNPEAAEAMMLRRNQGDPQNWADAQNSMGLARQPNFWSDLPSLNLPVLLVTGAEDSKFGQLADRMMNQLPQASHRSISESAHCVHLEQPAAFFQTVSRFMDDG